MHSFPKPHKSPSNQSRKPNWRSSTIVGTPKDKQPTCTSFRPKKTMSTLFPSLYYSSWPLPFCLRSWWKRLWWVLRCMKCYPFNSISNCPPKFLNLRSSLSLCINRPQITNPQPSINLSTLRHSFSVNRMLGHWNKAVRMLWSLSWYLWAWVTRSVKFHTSRQLMGSLFTRFMRKYQTQKFWKSLDLKTWKWMSRRRSTWSLTSKMTWWTGYWNSTTPICTTTNVGLKRIFQCKEPKETLSAVQNLTSAWSKRPLQEISNTKSS